MRTLRRLLVSRWDQQLAILFTGGTAGHGCWLYWKLHCLAAGSQGACPRGLITNMIKQHKNTALGAQENANWPHKHKPQHPLCFHSVNSDSRAELRLTPDNPRPSKGPLLPVTSSQGASCAIWPAKMLAVALQDLLMLPKTHRRAYACVRVCVRVCEEVLL